MLITEKRHVQRGFGKGNELDGRMAGKMDGRKNGWLNGWKVGRMEG